MITYIRTIPVYGSKFVVHHVDEDGLQWISNVYGLNNESMSQPIENYDAITLLRGQRIIIVFIGKITPGIIAHECKHAVNQLFLLKGIALDRHNDEPECYLMCWFVNRVYEALNIKITDK